MRPGREAVSANAPGRPLPSGDDGFVGGAAHRPAGSQPSAGPDPASMGGVGWTHFFWTTSSCLRDICWAAAEAYMTYEFAVSLRRALLPVMMALPNWQCRQPRQPADVLQSISHFVANVRCADDIPKQLYIVHIVDIAPPHSDSFRRWARGEEVDINGLLTQARTDLRQFHSNVSMCIAHITHRQQRLRR